MKKAALLITLSVFILENNANAQTAEASVINMFENKGSADMTTEDFLGAKSAYDYYLSFGFLSCTRNQDLISSFGLAKIDFSKSVIEFDYLESLPGTNNSPYTLELVPKSGKAGEGMKLYFPNKELTEAAHHYLKKKAEPSSSSATGINYNDNADLFGIDLKEYDNKPTGNFSSQLSQIICSWKNEFSALRGEKLIQSSDLLFKSTIQLEGGKSTEIKMGTIEVDFGRFEDKKELETAFYAFKAQIQNSAISCCKLVAEPESGPKELMFVHYLQRWKVSNPTDPGMKDLVVDLIISANNIMLKIQISSGDGYGDEEEGW